ncbi:MAG: acyltransferase [Candidatus Eremiobacteraeota bacterium]|nr:acyltransferase [Candidatus Eremiobacteraeota bacterium]MBC5801670.1 acyltransferase [Candidatus Eremiobacteraeota bacterium]MBC5824048.1 acyltransferase [Candidatus Eremiobacteraeota bacterium]
MSAPSLHAQVLLDRDARNREVPPSAAHRMPFADALRALAIGVVIVAHVSLHFGIDLEGLGAVGVDCFFVLSGFLLAPPFLRAIVYGHRFPSIGAFWMRRFLRIWPLYAASILFSIFLMLALHLRHAHPATAPDVATHLLMLHGFFPAYSARTFNGPLWTMAVDAEFYFLLPLGAWLAYRFCRGASPSQSARVVFGVLIIATVLSLAVRAIAYTKMPQAMQQVYFSLSTVYARNVLGMASTFSLGIALALVNLLRGRPSGKEAVAAALLGCIAISAAIVSGGATNPVLPVAVTYDLLGGIGAALILYGVGESQWTPVKRLVRLPFVSVVAALSYGFYLFHVPVELICLAILIRLHVLADHTLAYGFTMMIFFIPLLVAIALCGHRFVEVPFLTLKERQRESAGAV